MGSAFYFCLPLLFQCGEPEKRFPLMIPASSICIGFLEFISWVTKGLLLVFH